MSATNLTKNLKLSQFVASDKPSWLGDVNGDNKKIDDGYGVLAGEISKANDTASSAKSQSDANTQTLTNVNSELEDHGNRITALEAGGGTEQLEQRVNTLGTDVETLQTRADTFDDNITDHETKITTLTNKVEKLEPKVKSNTDNITSLTSTTNANSQSISDLIANVSLVTTKANKADTNASSALRIATDASNKANANTNSISALTSKVENITPITVGGLTLISSDSNKFGDSSGFVTILNEVGYFYVVMPVNIIAGNLNISTTPLKVGTIDLSGIYPASLGKNLSWTDITFYHMSRGPLIFTATKNTEEQQITLYVKSVSGTFNIQSSNTITPVFTFNLY